MQSQNDIKRTLISFSLALTLAITAFSVHQRNTGKEMDVKKKLEAKVYPKGNMIMED